MMLLSYLFISFFICRQLPAQSVHLLLLHIVKLVLIHCPAFFAIHLKFLLELH